MRPFRRRFITEWVLMFLLLPPLMVWLDGSSNFTEASAVIDDELQRSQTTTQSAATDVLIVEIDRRSLEALGTWPWARTLHAALLERLAAEAPRGVLLDVFLDTEGNEDQDAALARAMRKVPTYLPLGLAPAPTQGFNPTGLRAPLPIFVDSAAGIGHANALPDPDGLVRNLWRFEGDREGMYPCVGFLMTMQARELAFKTPQVTDKSGWIRLIRFGIPFAGSARTFTTLSYQDVVRGKFAAGTFRDKYVLVGASVDSGLSDVATIPRPGPSRTVAGIAIHAAAVDAMLRDEIIRTPSDGWHVLWIVLPIWLALSCFLINADHAVASVLVIAAVLCALFYALRTQASISFPLATPLIGIASAYLLWSWRSLVALLDFFKERADALNAVPVVAFETQEPMDHDSVDSVERRTDAFDRAIDRMSRLQTLLTEGLWHLPIPVLLCKADGTINQSNSAAQALLASAAIADESEPEDSPKRTDPLKESNFLEVLAQQLRTDLPGPQDLHVSPIFAKAMSGEYTTSEGKIFRVQAAPLATMRDTAAPTWVVALPDVTLERQAQKEREQWFRFLSHDLRSPQVTILSVLAMSREHPAEMPVGRLISSIESEARRTLHLTEAFMDMAEAESGIYNFAPVLPGSILLDAIDAAWSAAEAKGLQIHSRLGNSADATVLADGALLTRALTNLLTNAIRFTTQGGAIHLCIDVAWNEKRGLTEAVMAIRDEGSGMTPEQLESLMRSRHRRKVGKPNDGHGWGIGMSIVLAVVARHRGWIEVMSAVGAGTTFLIGIPLHANELPRKDALTSNELLGHSAEPFAT